MSLIDFMYQQKSYGEVLHSLGIPLDEVSLIPFTDGQTLIADMYGNTEGFIMENEYGGITVSDPQMNTIGSTNNIHDFTFIQDENYQQVGTLQDNVLGGSDLYDNIGQIEMRSTDNLFYGRDYYDRDMHLLGNSNETINDVMTFSMNESAALNSNFDASFDVNQFSDYLPAFHDFSMENVAVLNTDFWSMDAADIFDLFDLF